MGGSQRSSCYHTAAAAQYEPLCPPGKNHPAAVKISIKLIKQLDGPLMAKAKTQKAT